MNHSVVITTCNRRAAILRQSIESVLNQESVECELIIVNDSPQYRYRKEVDSLIASYGSQVNYLVNPEQKGANYSRNRGASVSSGDTISFLDDDDYWDVRRLKNIEKAIYQGFQVVYTDIVFFNEFRERILIKDDYDQEKVLDNLIIGNYIGGFSNVTMVKKCYELAGLLDESLPSYQDIDLWLRLAKHGFKFYHINLPLLYYRDSVSSISRNPKNKTNGLKQMFRKYEGLFSTNVINTNLRIESEMIMFLKNGWFKEARDISSYLKDISCLRRVRIYTKGALKYIAMNMLRPINSFRSMILKVKGSKHD